MTMTAVRPKFRWIAILLGWFIAGLIAVLGATIYISVLNAQTWAEDTEDTGFAAILWLWYLIIVGLPAGLVSALAGGIPLTLARLIGQASILKAVGVGVGYFTVTVVVDVLLTILVYESSLPLPGEVNSSILAVLIIQGISTLTVIGALVVDCVSQRRRP